MYISCYSFFFFFLLFFSFSPSSLGSSFLLLILTQRFLFFGEFIQVTFCTLLPPPLFVCLSEGSRNLPPPLPSYLHLPLHTLPPSLPAHHFPNNVSGSGISLGFKCTYPSPSSPPSNINFFLKYAPSSSPRICQNTLLPTISSFTFRNHVVS